MGAINDFQALIKKSEGFARTARYEIVITPPFDNDIAKNRNVSLLCDSIVMPGHTLDSASVKYGTAVATEMVTGHGYAGTIDGTFYLDAELDVKSFFDLWQESAVDTKTNAVTYYRNAEGKFNYVGSMEIYQLDAKSERTYGVMVEEVYPTIIGGLEYAYATVDTVQLLSVSFQYRKWKEITDTKSGRTEELIGTVTEKLPGNGVLQRGTGFQK